MDIMGGLERFLRYDFEQLPFVLLTLIIAFTLHEFAHAYFAYRFGDRTAYDQGRVTLNPAVHLDVIGTLLILLVGFGWAKPVPVNRRFFARPRLMGIIVSAVGPLSNLLLAFVGLVFYMQAGWYSGFSEDVIRAIDMFLEIFIQLNLVLFLFNLLPIPPLDGYRIVQDLVSPMTRAKLSQYEHWGMYIFLLVVFLPPLRNVTLTPFFSLMDPILHGMVRFIQLITPG